MKDKVIGKRKTTIIAGFVGNVVEWYDFALYGYMAGTLSVLFFPSENETASLLATYGVFAAGFVMRPLGSALFGWLGDAVGRSRTMLISVTMMALPTFLLGCLPTYSTLGIWAPGLLVAIRLVQGLSVGGEFSSSVTYLVETGPQERRGLSGSWANTGTIFGMLLGSGIAAALTTTMPTEMIEDWGWRLPFLFGGVLGSASILMRRRLPRSQYFRRYHRTREETSPLMEAFTAQRREMAEAILFASAYGAIFYLSLVYLPNWIHTQTGMALDEAMRINTAGVALLLLLIPVSGWLGDRVLRRTHLIAASMLAIGVVVWPLHQWLLEGGLMAAIVAQLALVILIAVPLGSAPAMFVELFPTRDRLSGYSVAYNLGLGIVGGSTPMIATWLIDFTGRPTEPAVFAAFMALMAFATLLFVRDRSREPLG